MTKAGRKLIKSAQAAARFSRLLQQFDLVEEHGATTVFVTKKGKVLGTVHGARYRGESARSRQ